MMMSLPNGDFCTRCDVQESRSLAGLLHPLREF
jgi:hypothetical protein